MPKIVDYGQDNYYPYGYQAIQSARHSVDRLADRAFQERDRADRQLAGMAGALNQQTAQETVQGEYRKAFQQVFGQRPELAERAAAMDEASGGGQQQQPDMAQLGEFRPEVQAGVLDAMQTGAQVDRHQQATPGAQMPPNVVAANQAQLQAAVTAGLVQPDVAQQLMQVASIMPPNRFAQMLNDYHPQRSTSSSGAKVKVGKQTVEIPEQYLGGGQSIQDMPPEQQHEISGFYFQLAIQVMSQEDETHPLRLAVDEYMRGPEDLRESEKKGRGSIPDSTISYEKAVDQVVEYAMFLAQTHGGWEGLR